MAGQNAQMVKTFPMATSLKLNFIVYKFDLIRSSSDLALAMQKCAYKWKVKYERKLNHADSKNTLSFKNPKLKALTTLTTKQGLKL